MTNSTVLSLSRMRRACDDGTARMARTRNRLTLREMGAACGVSGDAIGLWETGQRVPRGEPAMRYARLLDQLERDGA